MPSTWDRRTVYSKPGIQKLVAESTRRLERLTGSDSPGREPFIGISEAAQKPQTNGHFREPDIAVNDGYLLLGNGDGTFRQGTD